MIFVDTSFFAALLLPKDANHRRAVQTTDQPEAGDDSRPTRHSAGHAA